MKLETEMFSDAGGRLTEQTVPNGRSGDWKGLAADGIQFDGWQGWQLSLPRVQSLTLTLRTADPWNS